MEFHVIAQSSAGSTPWASERQSEVSEPPNVGMSSTAMRGVLKHPEI